MNRVMLAVALMLPTTLAMAGSGRDYGNPDVSDKPVRIDPTLTIRENAYAPGVGLDQYGRPVVLAPARKDQGGYYGDARVVRRDAYGPGIHMDQYGRPVVIVPR